MRFDISGNINDTHRSALDGCALGLSILTLVLCLAVPAIARAEAKTFKLDVESKNIDIGGGMTYAATTYDGTVPGPLLRARQGDEVTIHLINHSISAHGIDVYAAQLPPAHFSGDPTKDVEYTFTAEVPGVFVYHCSAVPVLRHVADGMYGMMIVDPAQGWPNGAAHEVMLVQGEFYGSPNAKGFITGSNKAMIDAQADFVVFNGAIEKYDVEHPIAIKAGELVRVFFVNAGPNLTSVFHTNGVIFDTVYPSGNPTNALHNIATYQVGPGSGAVFEFRVKQPGDYQFSDQAMAHPYKGAIGVFRAR